MRVIKRTGMICALCVLYCILTATYAYAATTGVVNANGGINMRALPDMESAVISAIPNKTEVDIHSFKDGWSLVTYDGATGYVYNKYMIIKRGDMLYRSRDLYKGMIPKEGDPDYAEYASAYPQGDDYPEGFVPEEPEVVSDFYVNDGEFVFDVEVDFEEFFKEKEPWDVVEYAARYLGTPYVWGGASPKGFDCSGFTSYVYRQFGYHINRTAAAQMSNGTRVQKSELRAGDLVFFSNNGYVDHVGIYVGNGQMIHSVKPGVKIRYDTISSGYYADHYAGATRIIP